MEQSAVENSVSTYVSYAPDGLFWLNLYVAEEKRVGISNHVKSHVLESYSNIFFTLT